MEGVQDIVEKVLIEEGHKVLPPSLMAFNEKKEAKEDTTKRLP